MRIQAHHPGDIEQLRQRSRQERNAKQRDRDRVVLLALEGHSAPAIARILARSRRFVQRWVYAYRSRGLDAIGPKRQPGRPCKLPREQHERFKERFLAGPTAADGVCSLRAKDAQRILQKEFGIEYTLAGVYALLHHLGFSCLMPRPCHHKNDPAQMQQWLQEAPLLSRERLRNTRTDTSKCGSRMKPASASRER